MANDAYSAVVTMFSDMMYRETSGTVQIIAQAFFLWQLAIAFPDAITQSRAILRSRYRESVTDFFYAWKLFIPVPRYPAQALTAVSLTLLLSYLRCQLLLFETLSAPWDEWLRRKAITAPMMACYANVFLINNISLSIRLSTAIETMLYSAAANFTLWHYGRFMYNAWSESSLGMLTTLAVGGIGCVLAYSSWERGTVSNPYTSSKACSGLMQWYRHHMLGEKMKEVPLIMVLVVGMFNSGELMRRSCSCYSEVQRQNVAALQRFTWWMVEANGFTFLIWFVKLQFSSLELQYCRGNHWTTTDKFRPKGSTSDGQTNICEHCREHISSSGLPSTLDPEPNIPPTNLEVRYACPPSGQGSMHTLELQRLVV